MMFLSVILIALIVGALAGGGIPRLAELKLRWSSLLFVALALRVAVPLTREYDFAADIPVGWAYIAAYGLIIVWLWRNWRVPGLQVAAVGVGANLVAVLANGGQMPIWPGAFETAGFTAADIADDPFHILLQADSVASFVASGGLLGDVVPLPVPYIRDVVSLGDLLLAMGIFWAIVAAMTRPEAPVRGGMAVAGGGATVVQPSGVSAPSAGIPFGTGTAIPADMTADEAAAAGVRRQSPYLRLVANRNFALLWIGQLVSLLGERIHQVAIGFLVFRATGSAMEVGFTFAATAIPNIVLGPLAGTLVDRWDRRRTMIACDLVRAAMVVAVPFVIEVHIALVYVMAFLIATVTLLFRPAKTALIPRVVGDRDLVAANSASSIADGAADLVGLPLAGVLIATLGSLELAFAIDGATYVLSAVLLLAMSLERDTDLTARAAPFSPTAVWREMAEGWRFLTRQAELFSNTVLSTVAQLAVGAEIVATLPYAERVLQTGDWSPVEVYAWMLGAIALGSILGGTAVGAIGDRLPKGRMVIAGFIGMGVALAVAGLVTQPLVAIGLFFVVGVTNMLFIIPTITLFQQRTPGRLMGRVVSSRQALVFGAIAASMAVSGVLAEAIGAGTVLVVFGCVCAAAGVVGILLPSMRNAR